jgi:hypothetical protein
VPLGKLWAHERPSFARTFAQRKMQRKDAHADGLRVQELDASFSTRAPSTALASPDRSDSPLDSRTSTASPFATSGLRPDNMNGEVHAFGAEVVPPLPPPPLPPLPPSGFAAAVG